MIYTRSPYYIVAPIQYPTDTNSVTFRVFAWNGSNVNKPANPAYEITKNVPSSTTTHLNLNISNIVSDFINAKLTVPDSGSTQLITGNMEHTAWVAVTVVYNMKTMAPFVPDIEFEDRAVYGYTHFTDGANFDDYKQIMISSRDIITIPRGKHIAIPFWVESGGEVITITGDSTSISRTLPSPANTGNYITYLFLNTTDINDDYTTLTCEGNSVILKLEDTCKYQPRAVRFLNRFGAYETLFFYKASRKGVDVSREEYQSLFVRPNGTYDVQSHQFRNIDTNGRGKLTLTTGFVDESTNATVEQLLLSEQVYVDNIPVNVTVTSQDYKMQINERLISYTMNFKEAFNKAQNI